MVLTTTVKVRIRKFQVAFVFVVASTVAHFQSEICAEAFPVPSSVVKTSTTQWKTQRVINKGGSTTLDSITCQIIPPPHHYFSSNTLSTTTTALDAAKRSSNRGDDDDDPLTNDDIKLDPLETIMAFLGTPIPLLPGTGPIPLFYPLALTAAAAVLPVTTALLLDAFFAGYLYLGREVIGGDDDDDDYGDNGESSVVSQNQMSDFAALAGAIASAGLLSPSSQSSTSFTTDTGGGWELLGATAISLAGATIVNSIMAGGNPDPVVAEENENDTSSSNDPLLDLWDKKLTRSLQQKGKGNDAQD